MRISVRFLNIGTPKQAKREKFKVEIVNVKQMCYSFVFYKWKGFEKTSHCTFVVHRCICTYNFDCHMCACLSVCNAVVRVSTKWNLLPLNANREKKTQHFECRGCVWARANAGSQKIEQKRRKKNLFLITESGSASKWRKKKSKRVNNEWFFNNIRFDESTFCVVEQLTTTADR